MGRVLNPAAWGRPERLRLRRPAERRSASRSATRALDVLELFGRARRPLRAVEIGGMLGLHPSTTAQLLKTMVDSAHLLFDARAKSYLPSPRLAGFAGWIAETWGADEWTRRLVAEVQARTGGVVTLTTPNGLFMQVIDAARGRGFEAQAERGLAVALFGSAIGGAWLAMIGEPELERLAARAGVPDAKLFEVRRSLAEIRLEGFADGPSHDGATWSIALALPAGLGPVPLVLGHAGPADATQRDRRAIHAIMREAVDRLTPPAADG